MTGKFEFIRDDVSGLREAGLFINLRVMGSPADAWMVVDGKRVLNFCTNNYLGLANHPRMKEAAQRAVEEWGVGPARRACRRQAEPGQVAGPQSGSP